MDPPPAPAPDTPILLPPRVELLISHDAKCLVRAFPAGRVQIKRLHVPAGRDHTLSGTFIDPRDGGKTTEADQTFSGPCFVYRVAAKEAGPCVLVVATGVDDDEVQVVYLDCLAPRPPPPKPVDPVVPPVPPVDPKVEKSPWDNAPGLRVMIVYPRRGALPAAQQSIVTGKRVRDYLDANTAKENGEAAYWILKTDEDVGALPAAWQKAYATQKGDRWVVVGNGARWEAGPLPADPDKMLELLGRYK